MTTITQTITALPPAPDPASPSTFASLAAPFAQALPTLGTEINTWKDQANTLAATLNAIAAGTAVGIPYTFSTTTADADPGAGFLRLDNATQNLTTTIRADLDGSDGTTYTDVLATFDDSTSTVKGVISLQKIADPTKWIVFSVSAIASPAGYKNITVAVVGASAASPFADGDGLVLKFTRTGDKGETGAAGTVTAASQVEMEAASSNLVAATPGTVNWHPGVAKAWIKCSGDGTTINASHNITSITDGGTGILTVTIATDFSSADYAIVASFAGTSVKNVAINTQAAGSFQAIFDGGSTDPGGSYYFACFGDQA